MSRKKWGVFCAAVMGVMFLSFFCVSGCAQKQDSNSKVITVWHWMTDRTPAFQELAKQFETETGIKVVFELYAPSDAYLQKVRAAAQGNTLPDIFGVLGEKRDFSSFIKAAHVLDLTPYMEADGAESKRDFTHKIALCKKGAKETKHWLRMIARANPQFAEDCRCFWKEAQELTLIFSSILVAKKS